MTVDDVNRLESILQSVKKQS